MILKRQLLKHYRRVVLQQKMRDHKIEKGEIHYEDTITTDFASIQDGLKRAPKGVNDGNGFAFVSHIGDVMPSGLLPIKAVISVKLHLPKFIVKQRYLKIYVSLTIIKANAAYVNITIFVADPVQEPML